jgi:hypothetical protein
MLWELDSVAGNRDGRNLDSVVRLLFRAYERAVGRGAAFPPLEVAARFSDDVLITRIIKIAITKVAVAGPDNFTPLDIKSRI